MKKLIVGTMAAFAAIYFLSVGSLLGVAGGMKLNEQACVKKINDSTMSGTLLSTEEIEACKEFNVKAEALESALK